MSAALILDRYAHQATDIDRLRAATREAGARVLYVAFMGSGKTNVAAQLIGEWVAEGARVLVLVHRQILMAQTDRRLRDVLTEADIGWIWKRHARTRADAPVQLASIDTLVRREMPAGITHIVIDEAHHTAAGKWQTVLGWAAPGTRLLGLTATPERLDGKPLGEFFDMMIEAPDVEALIAAGVTRRPEVWTMPDDALPDMRRAKKRAGDYTKRAAAGAMRPIVGRIFEHWKKHAGNRPAVGFLSLVSECKRMKRLFRERGVRTEILTGETSPEKRAEILKRLAESTTKVVWTCDALSEGWDFPGARCVIIARPTLSLTRYLQWCGRAMRAGDVMPVILDHAGCWRTFGLPEEKRTWDLHARRPKRPDPQVKRTNRGRVVRRAPDEIEAELAKVAHSSAMRQRQARREAERKLKSLAAIARRMRIRSPRLFAEKCANLMTAGSECSRCEV